MILSRQKRLQFLFLRFAFRFRFRFRFRLRFRFRIPAFPYAQKLAGIVSFFSFSSKLSKFLFHYGEETCCFCDASDKVVQCWDQLSTDFSCSIVLDRCQGTLSGCLFNIGLRKTCQCRRCYQVYKRNKSESHGPASLGTCSVFKFSLFPFIASFKTLQFCYEKPCLVLSLLERSESGFIPLQEHFTELSVTNRLLQNPGYFIAPLLKL